jgi:hypothetical protein
MLLAFVSVVGATVGCTVSGNTGRCCWGTLVETCARLQCVTITDALQKLSYMESIINSTFYNGSVTVLFTEVTTAGLGSNSFTIPDVHDDSDTVWQRCMMLLISRPCIFVTNFTATADTCSGCIWRQTASSPNESSPFDYAEQFVGCFTLPDRRATAHTGTLSAQPSSETTPMSRDEPPTSLTNEQLSPSSTTSPTKYANDTTTSVIIAVVVVVVLLLVGIGLAVALFLYKKGNDLKKQHDEQQLSSQSTPQPATTTLASVLPCKKCVLVKSGFVIVVVCFCAHVQLVHASSQRKAARTPTSCPTSRPSSNRCAALRRPSAPSPLARCRRR